MLRRVNMDKLRLGYPRVVCCCDTIRQAQRPGNKESVKPMEATQVDQAGASTNQRALEGVLPVFNLPYHDDESIDYDALLTQINWAYDQGANGLVMAMVSEVLRLCDVERKAVAQFVCQHGRQRGVVVISVGAESSYLASEYMRHAESVGADAVMAIPPIATALGEDELRGYYERILHAGSIPVIVQDASGYVGQPMSIDLQAGLLRDFVCAPSDCIGHGRDTSLPRRIPRFLARRWHGHCIADA